MRWTDILIIVVYLLGTIAIGIASRGKQEDADDYFTAGGGMSRWFGSILVGLSVAATLFSGITFMAYPSVLYDGNIVVYVFTMLVCVPLSFVVLLWFLPRYLVAGVHHPYDTIERRFGTGARTVASLMYVLMRIGWMAALIYAPTLAVMAAGGLSDAWFWPCILIIGLSSTIYTVFGGIRGVIVTDAIQFVVIAIGIAATVGYVLLKVPVGLGEAFTTLREHDLLNPFPMSLDPSKGFTVWTVVIGVSIANLSNYIGDQMSLQRYLATGTVRAAMRAFTINVVSVLAVLTLLAAVGLSLFLFYHFHHDPTLPEKSDKVFPHFIASQLPIGVSGLLLAAILAATMSSMTSGINALAGTITLDLQPRVGRPLRPHEQLRLARMSSLVVGVASTITAGWVQHLGSLYELTQVILGVFAGPLLVVMILSVTRIRVTPAGIMAGLAAGAVLGASAALYKGLAPLWTAPLASAVTLLVALAMRNVGAPAAALVEEPLAEPTYTP